MNERVFADDFKRSFMQEDEFLQFIEKREKNSSWQTVKSNELRFFAMKEEDSITRKLFDRLKEEGKRRCADIVMYGHTHKPDIDLSDDIIAINPGSISYPRQLGREASYVVMGIDKSGEASFVLKYVQ